MMMMMVAILFLVILLVPAAIDAATSSVVGIRLVFPEPLDGASCTPEEHNTVVSIMHDGIMEMMMMDQDSRMLAVDDFNFDDGKSDITDPSWCRQACRGFARGTCYVAYPPCDNTRRLTQPIQPVVDPEEFVKLCREENDAVLSTITDGVSEVSESCNKLLQTKMEVTCSDLSEESPVFIAVNSAASSLRVLGTGTVVWTMMFAMIVTVMAI